MREGEGRGNELLNFASEDCVISNTEFLHGWSAYFRNDVKLDLELLLWLSGGLGEEPVDWSFKELEGVWEHAFGGVLNQVFKELEQCKFSQIVLVN